MPLVDQKELVRGFASPEYDRYPFWGTVNTDVGPVSYSEIQGSPDESYAAASGGKARVTYLVPWNDRWPFARRMLGYPKIVDTPNGQYISRVTPQVYAHKREFDKNDLGEPIIATNEAMFPANATYRKRWLYATTVESVSGERLLGQINLPSQDPDTGLNLLDDSVAGTFYKFARVVIGFEPLPYRVYDDAELLARGFQDDWGLPAEYLLARYVTRHVAPSAEYLTLPYGQLRYVDGTSNKIKSKQTKEDVLTYGTPCVNGAGRIISTTELQYTWHQVPFIPEASYSLIGSVNDAPFGDYSPSLSAVPVAGPILDRDTFPKIFPAGTLLLTGVDIKTYRYLNGQFLCDVTYKMKYRLCLDPQNGKPYDPARGHNYVLRWVSYEVLNVPMQIKEFVGKYDWQLVTTTGLPDGTTIYPSDDFRKLFRPILD